MKRPRWELNPDMRDRNPPVYPLAYGGRFFGKYDQEFKKVQFVKCLMRPSIWIAIPTLALGILFSYMADSLIALQTFGTLQTASGIVATVLFVLFSAMLLGLGSALFIHWVFGFANHTLAFVAEINLSFALFFIGLGAALTIGVPWTALQLFCTFLFGSIILFFLSFITLFGSLGAGAAKITKYLKKRLRKR